MPWGRNKKSDRSALLNTSALSETYRVGCYGCISCTCKLAAPGFTKRDSRSGNANRKKALQGAAQLESRVFIQDVGQTLRPVLITLCFVVRDIYMTGLRWAFNDLAIRPSAFQQTATVSCGHGARAPLGPASCEKNVRDSLGSDSKLGQIGLWKQLGNLLSNTAGRSGRGS